VLPSTDQAETVDGPDQGGGRMTMTSTFTGFRPEAIQFLADLAVNNERSWFQPRKADYERLLKQPLEELCVALDERFRKAGLPMIADPARSPFRIYRDVRFSKDKSPYKTNIGADFPWVEAGADIGSKGPHGIGGYFHLQPGEIFVGGGMWHPEPPRLAAWRLLVDQDPAQVHAVIEDPSFVAEHGHVGGDHLKRIPTGFSPDHPEAELLKLKDVTFGRRLSDDEGLSPDLPAILTASLAAAAPVMRLLASLGD
jgi:uncharacterized protein (TIGR02453 family)